MKLCRRHRRFEYPSTDKLYRVLNYAGAKNFMLIRIELYYKLSGNTRHNRPKPIARGVRNLRFAQLKRLITHSMRTKFTSIKNVSSSQLPKQLVIFQRNGYPWFQLAQFGRRYFLYWINVYLGPPNVTIPVAGKSFMAQSNLFQADMLHTRTKLVPVKFADFMSNFARFCHPIPCAFNVICAEVPKINFKFTLLMPVKASIASVSLDGLDPTVLVYGALSRFGFQYDQPIVSTFTRCKTLWKATSNALKNFAKCKKNMLSAQTTVLTFLTNLQSPSVVMP